MIWRRLLVRSDSTIVDLHSTLLAFNKVWRNYDALSHAAAGGASRFRRIVRTINLIHKGRPSRLNSLAD
jgi:hypothetical protein